MPDLLLELIVLACLVWRLQLKQLLSTCTAHLRRLQIATFLAAAFCKAAYIESIKAMLEDTAKMTDMRIAMST